MTSNGTYPKWQNKDNIVFGSKAESIIEYKYIINNEQVSIFIVFHLIQSETTWEDGNNRKVDLSNFFESGKTVVVEDDGFNKVGRKPKVYPQGQVPVADGPPHTQNSQPIFAANIPSAPQAYHQMAASHTGGCSPKAG